MSETNIVTKPYGEMSSEKIARRFVLQLQTYFDAQKGMKISEFHKILGVSDYTWYSWKCGKIKRIALERIYTIAGKLNLNLSYLLDCEYTKSAALYKKFVEYNVLYKKLVTHGDPKSTANLIRKAAMTTYDVMIEEKIPVVMSIANIADKSNSITDDLICIDCRIDGTTYRIQIVPGLTISYCFGLLPAGGGQRILHEGTLSMTIIITICQYIQNKLRAESKKEEADEAEVFISKSREFSKTNS